MRVVILSIALLLLSVGGTLGQEHESSGVDTIASGLFPEVKAPSSIDFEFSPSLYSGERRSGGVVENFVMPIFDFSGMEHAKITNQNLPEVFSTEYSYGGELIGFDGGGGIYGLSEQRSVIGVGHERTLGFGTEFNITPRLSLTANVAYNQSVTSSYTIQGISASSRLSYAINDRLSAHVFGSYATSRGLIGPSYAFNSAWYYDFGGSFSYDFTDTFGLELGARGYHDSLSGTTQVIPVVVPYINIGEVQVGVDVGALVYSLLSNGQQQVGSDGIPPPQPMPRR